MLGNTSAVLPVTDVLSAVALPTMAIPPPALGTSGTDPAGMTEVVRSVLAGRVPPPPVPAATLPPAEPAVPTAACTAEFVVITSVALASRDPFLAPSLGFKSRFPCSVDVDAAPAGDAVKSPVTAVARGGITTVAPGAVRTGAAIPAERIPAFAAAAAQSSDSLVAGEIDGDAGEGSRAIVVQAASRALAASSAIVAKATSC